MIAAHKGEIPFAVFIIPFIAGIACGLNFIPPRYAILLTVILFVLAAIFILLNAGYKYWGIYKLQWLGGILIHSLLFCTGWLIVLNYNDLNNPKHFSQIPS